MEPIIARFTELNIRYAGASIFNVDSESITSFSYSDKSSGESDSMEQSNQTDSAFLSEICQTYGICMKVYSDKVILYGLQKALNKTPVLTVKKDEMESWSFDTSLDGNYTGGQLTYSNTDGKDIKYSVGGGNRILKITDKKPADYAEAERMIKAAVLLKNLETTTLSFSCPGRLDIVASQNIQIKGIGAGIDGKYHVLSVYHKISGGFKSDFELAKVE